MAKVTGLGGVFFKSADPDRLYAWYEQNLGMKKDQYEVSFRWREHDGSPAKTVWSIFKQDTTYFEPTSAPFMLNYRVDDLDALLEQLRAAGVWIDEKRENESYGRFAWIRDPDGNRIELWEPPKAS